MKRIFRYLPLLLLPAFFLPLAHAQYGFDIGIGFGAMQDKAASSGLDYNNNLASCTVGSANPTCVATNSLNSFSLGIGGNVMAWKHFGVGAEVNFQPSKPNYLDLPAAVGVNFQSRMTLYDFNGVYQPVRTKKIAFQLVGGVGGANLKYYETGATGSAIGASSFTQYFGSNNHFQVHGGVGVQFYVTDHVFIRPQFDIHYVPNLSQYGSNLITSETVWVGYTFGSQ